MNTTTISFATSGLASRDSAIIKRNEVMHEVEKGYHVIIDFTNVESLSNSYADELFGILFKKFGIEWLRKNLTVKFKNEFLRKTILDAIEYRKSKDLQTA